MKIQLARDNEPQEAGFLKVHIGDTVFRLTDLGDGRLGINKIGDASDQISIQPQVTNQIIIY